MKATINKQEIIEKYGRTPNDTGSPEVPVSYTHLDVYKRQRPYLPKSMKN